MKRKIITISIAGFLLLIPFATFAQNRQGKSLYDTIAEIEQKYPDLPKMNLKSAMTDTGTSREKMLLNDIRRSKFYEDLVKYVVLTNRKMSKEFAEAETADTSGFYYMYINTSKKDAREIGSADRSKNILGVGAGLSFDNFGFGYSLGLDYDIFVSRRLALSVGFGYHRQNRKSEDYGFKIPDTEFIDFGQGTKYNKFLSDKISIPAGLTYYLPLTNGTEDLEVVNLMFHAGVEFYYGLNMNETISVRQTTNTWDLSTEKYISWDYNETKDLFSGEFSGNTTERNDIYQHLHGNVSFDENTYKKVDLCLSFGIGLQLTRWFEVWAGYKQGMINKIATPEGNSKYLNNFYLRFAFNIIH